MNFSKALDYLFLGNRIRRQKWKEGRFCEAINSNTHEITVPQIVMTTPENERGVYTPSQCEIFALDWELKK